MSKLSESAQVGHGATEPSATLVTIIAVATGALVANLYYAQPLIGILGPQIGLTPSMAGAVTGVTQIGYGVGLFFLVSLADRVESKKLVLTMLGMTFVCLLGLACSRTAAPFFIASFLLGLGSTAAQVLVPFVAHLVSEQRRGRVVGNVMGGLLAGIMLARPVALFVAASFGWRTVFLASAILMLGIGAMLMRRMPRQHPQPGQHYGQILVSMLHLLQTMPTLRWRTLYQALMFTAFNMFWTAVPIMLHQRFHMSQQGIGMFALAGAGGALAAPIAGRWADRGLTRVVTAASMLLLGLAFFATTSAVRLAQAIPCLAVVVLVVLSVMLDAAVQANQVTSQRIIFAAPAATRGRVNAIYMTIVFVGGAMGSMLGTAIYQAGGWTLTAGVGGLIGAAALTLFGLEMRLQRRT